MKSTEDVRKYAAEEEALKQSDVAWAIAGALADPGPHIRNHCQ
jgi:hypothetical protein